MTSNKDAFKDYKIGDIVYIVENDYPNYCENIGRVVGINPGGVLVRTDKFSDSLFHFYYQVAAIDLSALEKLIYGI